MSETDSDRRARLAAMLRRPPRREPAAGSSPQSKRGDVRQASGSAAQAAPRIERQSSPKIALQSAPLILISLHPRYLDAIVSGKKVVELRKRRMPMPLPATAAFYITTPVRRVMAVARLVSQCADSPAALWRQYGGRTGVTRAELIAYFGDAAEGWAVELADARAIDGPTLAEMRRAEARFAAPQSVAVVGGAVARAIRRAASSPVGGDANPTVQQQA